MLTDVFESLDCGNTAHVDGNQGQMEPVLCGFRQHRALNNALINYNYFYSLL